MKLAKATCIALALTLVVGTSIAVHGRTRSPKATTTLQPVAWVSGEGADDAPCTRSQPGAKIYEALSKVAPGGEVQVIDAGSYDNMIIFQAVTVDGESAMAGIAAAALFPVSVSAGPNDIVVLRHLTINGGEAAGIYFQSGAALYLEDCKISGMGGANDIQVVAGAGRLSLERCDIDGGAIGVFCQGSSTVSIHNCTIRGTQRGVFTSSGNVNVSNSVIADSSAFALCAESSGIISAENCTINNNATAVVAVDRAQVRLSNNNLFDNTVTLSYAGSGVVYSAGNNPVGGNTSSRSPNGPLNPI